MKKHKKLLIRGISLSDQIFFSAANFLFTMMLAKFYSEIELAAYGIGLSIAMTLQGIQRSSYMVQNAVLPPAILRRRALKVMGQQGLVLGALLLCELGGLWVYGLFEGASPFGTAILTATLVLTLLYIQLDFDRIILIKHERFVDPLITSFLFLALNGALFILIPLYHLSFGAMMGILAGYGVLKSLWLVFAIGRPDFFWGWRFMVRDFRKYFAASLIGVLGYGAYNNAPIFILGSVAAPIQSAAFAGMRSLLQPLLVIVRSLDIIDKNFFQQNDKTLAGLRRSFLRLLFLYGGGALVMLSGMALFGAPLVELVYGAKYAPYSSLLFGWGLVFFMLTISNPIETVLVKRGRLNVYNLYRIPAGVVGVLLSLWLCKPYGAWGAILACFGGWIVSVSFALWLIRDVLFLKEKP